MEHIWAMHPLVLIILGYLVLNFLTQIISRIIRLIMVTINGWPTGHLMDADGDIVHPPIKKEDQ